MFDHKLVQIQSTGLKSGDSPASALCSLIPGLSTADEWFNIRALSESRPREMSYLNIAKGRTDCQVVLSMGVLDFRRARK